VVTPGEGVVLSSVGGRYRVFSGDGVVEASLRGRVKRGQHARVVVGDRVLLRRDPGGSTTIEGVGERRSLLRRRSPRRGEDVRAVAANVDQIVVVGASREPAWDSTLLDRFVAVAEANELPVMLVVNKCDLEPAAEALLEPYARVGYAVVGTSVRDGRGLDVLRRHLEGSVSVLTGPSGVGKSSLLNALQPGLRLRTADVSRKKGTGRHTTVAAEMYPFLPHGFVVDTPGLRDIGLWALMPQEVTRAFPEIARLGAVCRFDNCRHLGEPACEVEAAAGRGEIAASRLSSYRRLLGEALEAGRPWQ
jgi:ribosome biogenesis GTPase / thiamine phosphate phosphatase